MALSASPCWAMSSTVSSTVLRVGHPKALPAWRYRHRSPTGPGPVGQPGGWPDQHLDAVKILFDQAMAVGRPFCAEATAPSPQNNTAALTRARQSRGPTCVAYTPRCTLPATGVHHPLERAGCDDEAQALCAGQKTKLGVGQRLDPAQRGLPLGAQRSTHVLTMSRTRTPGPDRADGVWIAVIGRHPCGRTRAMPTR
jgi:hypothetical protein